eukprot:TRINITY_DN16804_c0_g1_i1.p1 TRINITY_DN16804_c0_g1~~TRINITY_DN16804_c0_g1_i1.p1  ORF type:complete len:602 (+),score=188.52 TRINITY_DN16804_c0_g1_i1:236-2041(+)
MTDEPSAKEEVAPKVADKVSTEANGGKETDEVTEMVTDEKKSTDAAENAEASVTPEAADDGGGDAEAEVKGEADKEGEKDVKADQKKTRQKREKVFVPPPMSPRPQRQRKSLERFAVEDTRDKAADEDIKPGKGVPLKDIPSIAANIAKVTRNDEIVGSLYTILFGKRGKALVFKKSILEFSGFPWKPADNEAKERAKVRERLERYTREGLQQMLDLLDLPKNGKKDDQVQRILDFLEKPVKEGHLSPTQKSGGSTKKRTSREEKDDDEYEEGEDEDEKPVKKKARTPKSPAGKKRKAPLRDASLKKVVKELLTEGAEAKKMTLDEVTVALGEHFTGDLRKKADLIKEFYEEFAPADKDGDEKMPDAPEAEKEPGETAEEAPVSAAPAADAPTTVTTVTAGNAPAVEKEITAGDAEVAEAPAAEAPAAEKEVTAAAPAESSLTPEKAAAVVTAVSAAAEAAEAAAEAATAAAVLADSMGIAATPVPDTPSEAAAALSASAPADTEIVAPPIEPAVAESAAAGSTLAAEEEKGDTAATDAPKESEDVGAATGEKEPAAESVVEAATDGSTDVATGKAPMEVGEVKEAAVAGKETVGEVAAAE